MYNYTLLNDIALVKHDPTKIFDTYYFKAKIGNQGSIKTLTRNKLILIQLPYRQSDNSTTTTFNNLEASYNTTLNLMRQQHEIIRQQELLIIQQSKQLEMQLNILQKHPSGQVQFNYPGTSNAQTVQEGKSQLE